MDRRIALIVVAELCGTSLWFSGNNAIRELAALWNLSGPEQAWLLMAVQLGFIVGTLGLAASGLADESEQLDAVPDERRIASAAACADSHHRRFTAQSRLPRRTRRPRLLHRRQHRRTNLAHQRTRAGRKHISELEHM